MSANEENSEKITKSTGNHFEIIGLNLTSEQEFLQTADFIINNAEETSQIQFGEHNFDVYIKDFGEGVYCSIYAVNKNQVACMVPYLKGNSKNKFFLSQSVPSACGNEGELLGEIQIGQSKGAMNFSLINFLESDAVSFSKGKEFEFLLSGLCYGLNCFTPKKEKFVPKEGPSKGKELTIGLEGYYFPLIKQPQSPIDATKYLLRGEITDFKEFKNSYSGNDLLKITLDTRAIKIDLVANKELVTGEIKKGNYALAHVWVQGYI